MTSTAGAYAVAAFCSSDCYRRFKAASVSSGLPQLARAVSGATANQQPAICQPQQPYLGPSFDLRFEPVAYGGAAIVALPPVEIVPARPVEPEPPPPPPAREAAPVVEPDVPPPVTPTPKREAAPAAEVPAPAIPRHRPPPAQPKTEFVPSLGAEQEEDKPAGASHWARIAVIAAVFMVASVFWFVFRGQSVAISQPVVEGADSSWQSGWGSTPEGGKIQLYKPSGGWSDYRMEARISRFLGIEWVCRAADADNYYIIRLTPGRYRNVMRLHRAAIVEGIAEEETQTEVPVAEARGDDVSALLEVRGDKFRLFLGGVRAATWTDVRLTTGGAGEVITSGSPQSGSTRITPLDEQKAQER